MSKDLLGELIVPANPTYDWATAEEQSEYVNPVTLNNREIQMANAAIVVTQQHIKVNRKIAEAKHWLQEAKHALEDFERDLLLRFPAPSTSTKSTKLLQVYVYSTATSQNLKSQYDALVTKVRELDRELLKWEAEADNCHMAFQAIKLAGEHIQTHLSFVKNEQKNARAY